jgi:hypothetical protein
MTPAERKRRQRQRKGTFKTPTVRQLARAAHVSERTLYYARQLVRYSAIDWDDIFDGKSEHGRIGLSLIADVCRYCDSKAQREFHDMIKADGAAAARRVWRLVKSDLRPQLVSD